MEYDVDRCGRTQVLKIEGELRSAARVDANVRGAAGRLLERLRHDKLVVSILVRRNAERV